MSESFIVGFDEAHKPRGRIDTNYTHLKKHLESQGFICQDFMEFPIRKQNLRNIDILVVPCPDFAKFSKDEIESVYKWVIEKGGGLLVLSHAGGDKGRRSNLSEIVEKFGIQFENDQVLDKEQNFGIENLPEITTFTPPHPATEDVNSLCFRAGCSLSTFGAASVPIVISNETSDPFSSPLVVASEAEKGRVIACGSYEIFRDKIAGGFDHDQHAQFASNVFDWLKTEHRATIKSKAPQTASRQQSVPSGLKAPQGPAPGQSQGTKQATSINIQSDITISDKSDLAGLFYALLNEVDVVKQRIEAIINTVVASEEQILAMKQKAEAGEQAAAESESSQPAVDSQVFTPDSLKADLANIAKNHKESEPVAETVSEPEPEGNAKGLFEGDDEAMSPLPPRPPSMLKRPSNGDGDSVPVSEVSEEDVFVEDEMESLEEPAEEPEEEEELSMEEIQAEIETLQSKLSSVNDLRDLVENKYKMKKYTEKQYKKQIKRLERDKEKTLERLEALEEILKNV